MSINDLAVATELTFAEVLDLEMGETLPGPVELDALAFALGCSADDLKSTGTKDYADEYLDAVLEHVSPMSYIDIEAAAAALRRSNP